MRHHVSYQPIRLARRAARCSKILVLCLGLCVLTRAGEAAETVHLFLKSNGEDIQGESTQTTLGRENSIECLSFVDSVRTAREPGQTQSTERRTYAPIIFRKRIDKSSPLLAKALVKNEVIEGEFRFYRELRILEPLGEKGSGTVEHFFTIEFAEGRIASIRRVSPDTIDPASATEPPTEEVSIVFHNITWTYIAERTMVSFSDVATFEESAANEALWPAYDSEEPAREAREKSSQD